MKKYFAFLVIGLLFSCSKTPVETVFFNFDNQSGVFIVNEGNFMFGNASLSFYQYNQNRVFQQIFQARNQAPLGDVAQSMELHNGLAWVVINNSGKIYVADANTMEYQATITGLNSPRYIHFINDDKAYVSDLYSSSIHIIHPKTYQKIGEINLQAENKRRSSEQLIAFDDYVFTNCWSNGNEVLVIDSRSNNLVKSIEVGAQPQSMVLDKNNKLWVLCDGAYEGHAFYWERPALVRIDAPTLEVEKLYFFDLETNPTSLEINGTKDTLYYINRNIYRMPVLSSMLPEEPFIESTYPTDYGGFYSLGIHPFTSEIFISDAIDHQQNGMIYKYHPDGHFVESFTAGVNPGAFYFKNN